MMTVAQVSKRTGVSVRTLHHYDQIGLLKPTEVTEAGYRLYDDSALDNLQNLSKAFYINCGPIRSQSSSGIWPF